MIKFIKNGIEESLFSERTIIFNILELLSQNEIHNVDLIEILLEFLKSQNTNNKIPFYLANDFN